MAIPYKKSKNGIIISVRVEPRSSKRGIAGISSGSPGEGRQLKVKLTAPPVGGAANEQLIEVLSEAFGVKKSAIRILKGLSSKNKVVEIEGAGEADIEVVLKSLFL
ncbi:MAG: DUF167 domain-containing protein [Thermodesulfovibrionales bacterium]|nr:DUF167 domain-containing protein [Thermodesulfovibrionales bacterium]